MAGLVAIVSRDAASRVGEAELAQFAEAYEAIRGTGERLLADAGPRVRVAVIRSGGGRGEIDRAGEAWTAFVGNPQADGLLTGTDLVDLDGQFALVSWDPAARRVRVAPDPFAMQTLFVAERGPFTYASTSALALAKFLRAAPDRFGLEVFLRAGYHFGRLTNWVGIERIEPGTSLDFGVDDMRRTVYWRPTIDRDVARMGLAEAADHCLHTAARSFGRAFADGRGHWVDLTGGFDSRLLALLLERTGVEFACNTRGDTDDEDRRIASLIADAKGWDLFDPTLPPDWHERLPELLPLAVAWGDGNLQALELSWVLWVHAQMGQRRARLLSGGGGEHWRGFAWSQEFLAAGRTTRVNMDNWIDMRLLHPQAQDVFAREVTPSVRDDFRRRMNEWAEPYGSELNTVQLDVMYAYKMTGHFGAYRSADDACLSASLPFYLKPVFEAVVSADHRHRANHRLMREVISRLDHEIASVRTATGGPATPWSLLTAHRYAPYYARIARRAITKVTQTTLGRPLLASPVVSWWAPRAAQAVAVESLALREGERARAMRSRELFNIPALERYFEDAVAGRTPDAQLLGRIITVELALRQVDAAVEP